MEVAAETASRARFRDTPVAARILHGKEGVDGSNRQSNSTRLEDCESPPAKEGSRRFESVRGLTGAWLGGLGRRKTTTAIGRLQRLSCRQRGLSIAPDL